MYNKIYNPTTKRFVNIQSKLGQSILKSYIYMLGGASQKKSSVEVHIERQISLWCGVHSMNHVLQDSIVSAKYSIDFDLYVKGGKLNLFKVCKSLLEDRNETNKSERRIVIQERCNACDYLIGMSIIDNRNRFREDGTDRKMSVQIQHKKLNMTWKEVLVYDTIKQNILKECGINSLDVPMGAWNNKNTYEFCMKPTEAKLKKIPWLKDILDGKVEQEEIQINCPVCSFLNNVDDDECSVCSTDLSDISAGGATPETCNLENIVSRIKRITVDILKPHTKLLCPLFAGESPVDDTLQQHITSESEVINMDHLIEKGLCDPSGNFSIDVIGNAYKLLGYYTKKQWRSEHSSDESYVQKLDDYSKDSKFIGVSINVPGHWVAITKTARCPDFTYLDSVGEQVECGDIKKLFNRYASESAGYIAVFNN